MQNTSKKVLMLFAILAVLVGLFMITVAPFLIQTSMERVLTVLKVVIEEEPKYASGLLLFSFAYPFYRGLIFIGGIILICLAGPISKGKEWTFPVSILASAFPSVGGMFMLMPYVSWVDGFPIPVIVAFVGLLFFWVIILLRNVDKWQKWGQFLTMTFAGMLATHAFIVGIGNFRVLLTRANKPMYDGVGEWVLAWSQPIQWMCVILLFIAFFQLAARNPSGWWLTLISVISLAAIDISMQIIRLTMSESTSWDYSYGLPMIIGLLVVLFIPKFKAALLNEYPQPMA